MNDDKLDRLLEANAAPLEEVDPTRRDELWRRTVRVQRNRRFGRWALRGTALLGTYAAGVLTAGLLPFGGDVGKTERPAVVEQATPLVAAVVKKSAPRTVSTAGGKPKAAPRPRLDRYERLRREADVLSQDPDRIALATRRYAAALAVATPEQQSISPKEDHWLLMALKLERQKEKAHASDAKLH
ncbi:MAG: hypothetical protein ACRDD1_17830 [Planctomycetia bacterium]